jgi:hypothetical protein
VASAHPARSASAAWVRRCARRRRRNSRPKASAASMARPAIRGDPPLTKHARLLLARQASPGPPVVRLAVPLVHQAGGGRAPCAPAGVRSARQERLTAAAVRARARGIAGGSVTGHSRVGYRAQPLSRLVSASGVMPFTLKPRRCQPAGGGKDCDGFLPWYPCCFPRYQLPRNSSARVVGIVVLAVHRRRPRPRGARSGAGGSLSAPCSPVLPGR